MKINKWLLDMLKVLVGVGIVALISSINFSKYVGDVVRIADIMAAQSRGMSEDALMIECRSLLAQKRRAEMYDVASRGYNAFRTYEWRYLYGMACAFRYEDKGDFSALNRAEELFRVCANELPYDPRGHIQWGWSLSHLGRRDEARREFLKALAIDPDNQVAKDKLQYVQPLTTLCKPKPPASR